MVTPGPIITSVPSTNPLTRPAGSLLMAHIVTDPLLASAPTADGRWQERELGSDPVGRHVGRARRYRAEVDAVTEPVVRRAAAAGIAAQHSRHHPDRHVGDVVVGTAAFRPAGRIRSGITSRIVRQWHEATLVGGGCRR